MMAFFYGCEKTQVNSIISGISLNILLIMSVGNVKIGLYIYIGNIFEDNRD